MNCLIYLKPISSKAMKSRSPSIRVHKERKGGNVKEGIGMAWRMFSLICCLKKLDESKIAFHFTEMEAVL